MGEIEDAPEKVGQGGVLAHVQPDGGRCPDNAGLIVSGVRSARVDTAATEFRARAPRAVTGPVFGGGP
ncbi:hypothetical protein ABZ642_00035 [Streptomyces sp. NPDC007157]|uniref:hypothetical protein n=1 Tax=Streptomyces sp. NPDC007157 TaxID=3154681 RepID=UPI0033E44FEC